jgi:hypothetical protein
VRSLVEQRVAAKPGADRSRGRDAGAADGER